MLKEQKKVLGEFEGSNAVFRIAAAENTGAMSPSIISNSVSAQYISEMIKSFILDSREYEETDGGLRLGIEGQH